MKGTLNCDNCWTMLRQSQVLACPARSGSSSTIQLRIWRYDPKTGENNQLHAIAAEGFHNVKSL
jgi:hypothetical protein